jgi:hypothetical protein
MLEWDRLALEKIIGQGPSDVRFDKNRDPPANCMKFGAWHHHPRPPIFNEICGPSAQQKLFLMWLGRRSRNRHLVGRHLSPMASGDAAKPSPRAIGHPLPSILVRAAGQRRKR